MACCAILSAPVACRVRCLAMLSGHTSPTKCPLSSKTMCLRYSDQSPLWRYAAICLCYSYAAVAVRY
eukprot:3898328-Rhodomonas_salina.2